MSYIIQPLNGTLSISASTVNVADASAFRSGIGAGVPLVAGTDYQTPLVAGTDYQTPLVSGTDYQAPLVAGTDYQTPLVAGTDYQTPLVAGTDYQAHSDALDEIAGLEPEEGDVIAYVSGAWTAGAIASNDYTAGTGLTLTEAEFSIDTAVVADLSTAQSLSNKTLDASRYATAKSDSLQSAVEVDGTGSAVSFIAYTLPTQAVGTVEALVEARNAAGACFSGKVILVSKRGASGDGATVGSLQVQTWANELAFNGSTFDATYSAGTVTIRVNASSGVRASAVYALHINKA